MEKNVKKRRGKVKAGRGGTTLPRGRRNIGEQAQPANTITKNVTNQEATAIVSSDAVCPQNQVAIQRVHLDDAQRDLPATLKRKTVATSARGSKGKKRNTKYRMKNMMTNRQPPSAPTPAQFPGADLDNPLETPAIKTGDDTPNFNGSAAPDKLHAEGLAADLDFYGTNEGLTLFDDKNDTHLPAEPADQGEEAEGSHSLPMPDKRTVTEDEQNILQSLSDSRSKILQRMRRKIKEQEEYILELEDTVLELQEKLQGKKFN